MRFDPSITPSPAGARLLALLAPGGSLGGLQGGDHGLPPAVTAWLVKRLHAEADSTWISESGTFSP